MYALTFVNIPDLGTFHFDSETDATAYGVKVGFEFRVYRVEGR